ncbi:hypothetical protein GCM10023157_14260 [Gluconacetobacter asukensis]
MFIDKINIEAPQKISNIPPYVEINLIISSIENDAMAKWTILFLIFMLKLYPKIITKHIAPKIKSYVQS